MGWTHVRAQIAVTLKNDPTADVSELRRDLRAERLAEHIAKTADAAPPLTVEQRNRLAVLLLGGAR
jgi:hypothetical protein